MPKPQTRENHAAFDPVYHYTAMPLILLANVLALTLAVRVLLAGPTLDTAIEALFRVVLAGGILFLGACVRLYSLRVQDRVIAIEVERRYERLGGSSTTPLAERLEPRQLVALRFAGDAELVALADAAAAESLAPAAIKARINHWRPDYRRI
jgi:hypothetical protein